MPNDTPERQINYMAGYSDHREVEEFRVRLMYDFARAEYRAVAWVPMTITDLRFVVDGETHDVCVHYTASRVVRFSVKTKVTTSIEWVADAVEVK